MLYHSPYRFLVLAFLIAALGSSLHGQRRDVRLESDPAGATVEIIEGHRALVGSRLTTPATAQLRSSRDVYVFEFSLPGHESVRLSYDWREDRGRNQLSAVLPELQVQRTFSFSSDPSGAEVLIEGQSVGRTPLRANVSFSRQNRNRAWPTKSITYRLDGYDTATAVLERDSPDHMPTARLNRLRVTRTFNIRAETETGQSLEAALEVNGEDSGTLPQSVTLAFFRPDRRSEWNTHKLRAFIDEVFLPEEIVLSLDSDARQTFVLKPVTELPVTRYFPIVEAEAQGRRIGIDRSAPIGTFDRHDIDSPGEDLRPVTNYTRDQDTLRAVNSFCLTPDGQQVIYSETRQREDGEFYANLYVKSSSDRTSPIRQLTHATNVFDTRPSMSREEGADLVVFQSNRYTPESWDISSLYLSEGGPGGVRQITRDIRRLNYMPFISSEAHPVYFSSSETRPTAEGFISHARVDGTSITHFQQSGEQIRRAPDRTLFFVRRADHTGNLQIYSITSDGRQFSSVINDAGFARSNVHSPDVSPDGSRLLFVSDYHADELGRRNNSIYVFDRETNRIQQITDNGSDDIQPRWSPTEPGVIFFLSNREGIYNIWRLRVVAFD